MKADRDKLREMWAIEEDGGKLRKMKPYERIWRHMKVNESKWRQMRTNDRRGSQMEAIEGN